MNTTSQRSPTADSRLRKSVSLRSSSGSVSSSLKTGITSDSLGRSIGQAFELSVPNVALAVKQKSWQRTAFAAFWAILTGRERRKLGRKVRPLRGELLRVA